MRTSERIFFGAVVGLFNFFSANAMILERDLLPQSCIVSSQGQDWQNMLDGLKFLYNNTFCTQRLLDCGAVRVTEEALKGVITLLESEENDMRHKELVYGFYNVVKRGFTVICNKHDSNVRGDAVSIACMLREAIQYKYSQQQESDVSPLLVSSFPVVPASQVVTPSAGSSQLIVPESREEPSV